MKITEQYTQEKEQDHLSVQDANYIGDFAIRLEFSDGYKPLVDFKPFLEESTHPAVKKYLNEELFKNLRLSQKSLKVKG